MTNLRHVGAALVMTVLAIACAVGTVEGAPAAKEYMLINAKTGKYLTNAGGTLSDNNIVAVQFAPPAPTYRTSEWSKWSRTEGIEYRYRWGWSPQNSRQIDAIYAIRNLQNRVWYGTARTHCSGNELARSEQITLQPNQSREMKFKTPHCGTTDKPWFELKIVQSNTL